jgi:hypothetical protein
MRINVISPLYLSDVHLRAEYREILMAPHYYNRSSAKGIDRSKISPKYTLNKGHAYMWYDKMLYIKERHDALEQEMIERGFKTREVDCITPLLSNVLSTDMNSYTVTKEDLEVNVDRVMTRIREMEERGKLSFYKYRGESLTSTQWEELYWNMLN